MTNKFKLFFLIIFLPGYIYTQTLGPNLEEAPESLFAAKIYSDDVDLFVSGSWDMTLQGSLGLAYNTETQELYRVVYPGMVDEYRFQQIPDLTISLWLYERFFFETTVNDEYDFNTFLLGYEGKEDEFVQKVRIGNTDLGIASYGYFTMPEASTESLGAYGLFKTSNTEHELLFRYDPAQEQKKIFVGSNEIIEETINPGDYVKGIFFVLPDNEIENFEMYIEDKDGQYTSDNKKYRKYDQDDAIVSLEDGTIQFKERPSGKVLVYYEKGSLQVGDSGLGSDALPLDNPSTETIDITSSVDFYFTNPDDYFDESMADWEQAIDSKDCLILYENGKYSAFESAQYYTPANSLPSSSWRTNLKLVKKGDESKEGESLSINIDSSKNTIEVYDPEASSPRNFRNRFPFADGNAAYSEISRIYGPYRNLSPTYSDYQMNVQIKNATGSYNLDGNILPGSVRIKINGQEESRYNIDYQTGSITFNIHIFSGDRIEVFYKTSGDSDSGGDILFGTGNTFIFGDNLKMELGSGIRWKIPGDYSKETEENTGTFVGSYGIEYYRENFDISVDAGLSISTPDTTGYLRLMGMESEGISFLLEYHSYPSSTPWDDPGNSMPSLDAGQRGFLYYKDFNLYDNSGQVVSTRPYTSTSYTNYAYETGSKIGPYIAEDINESVTDDKIMVMDYELDSSKNWVGSQIVLRKFADPIDLSDYEALRFSYMAPDDNSGTVQVFVQIGALDEDFDGDNKLDEETSKYSRGFLFNDTSNSSILYVGGGKEDQGNYVIDTEDINGNDSLESEDINYIYTEEITNLSSGWHNYTLNMSTLDNSDRKKLSAVNSVRIIIIHNSGSPATGRFLVSTINLLGSAFKAEVLDGDDSDISAKEIFETNAEATLPVSLTNSFSEVNGVFHSGGEDQKILEIKWTGVTEGSERPSVTGYTTPVPINQYKKLVFYTATPIITDTGSNGTMTFSFTDAQDKGIHASFTPSANSAWQKIEIDLENKTISSNGTKISDATVIVEKASQEISVINFIFESITEGTVYIDEIHFEDPIVEVSTAFDIKMNYSKAGTIIPFFGTNLLANLKVYENMSYRGQDFAAEFSESYDSYNTSSTTEISADVLYFNMATKIKILNAEEDNYYSGSHSVLFPNNSSRIQITDSFSKNEDPNSNSITRSNSINLNPIFFEYIILKTEASIVDELINQSWIFNFSTRQDKISSLQVRTNLSLGSDEYEIKNYEYYDYWKDSYNLIMPWDEDAYPDRESEISSTIIFFNNEFTQISSDPSLSFSGSGDLDRMHYINSFYDLKVPMNFINRTRNWKLNIGIERSISNSINIINNDFIDDFEYTQDKIKQQKYFFYSIPFYEIFSEKQVMDSFTSNTSEFDNALYSPGAYMEYSRMEGSYLTDLLIPSYSSVYIKRNYIKEESSYYTTNSWEFTSRFSAINLFGKYGSHSVFDFYYSDEFTTIFNLDLKSTDNSTPEDYEFTMQNFILLTGKTENKITLENTLNYLNEENEIDVRDDISVIFTWYMDSRKNRYFWLIGNKDKNDLKYENIESFTFSTIPDDENINEFELTLSHSTSLLIENIGFIKANLGFGIRRENISDDSNEQLYLLGLTGGLELKLTF